MTITTAIIIFVSFLVGFVVAKMTGGEGRKRIVYREHVSKDKLDPSIREALQSGSKIDAIKRYRELYKVDLKEAKEAIDTIERQS
jgi:ribosomal protein L7/L12